MLLRFKSDDASNQKFNGIVLAGDVGATKTRLALFRINGESYHSLRDKRFKTSDYKSLVPMIEEFIQGRPSPDAICTGVAGPVLNGRAKLSNIDWVIDQEELSQHFRVKKVKLINDLEANAYGLAVTKENEIVSIQKVDQDSIGNAAVIAPGTGLGEAGIFWDGKIHRPFASEGGHSDFAPREDLDWELYKFLQSKFGHVSWERLLSGPGIVNIYNFLRDVKKMEEPSSLKQAIDGGDAAAIISEHARTEEICRETLALFFRYLAFESANLVVKFKATSGLFIGGGIIPKIFNLLDPKKFLSNFLQSGRMNLLLKTTPVSIIMNPDAALMGSAYCATA